MVRSEGQGFMSAFAQEFAEKCVKVLLARLPKPNVVQPRYLTVDQAAVYISHTKRSFEYLITKNLFPVVRRDRLILIDREDLDRFMTRHKASRPSFRPSLALS
jgi:excisionase family DNA binding protein